MPRHVAHAQAQCLTLSKTVERRRRYPAETRARFRIVDERSRNLGTGKTDAGKKGYG